MSSQEQVAYHYAMLTQQQREQEEAQARANAQAAALQSQRDAELSQQQLVQQRQQQQYAAQREALQAGYGQQSQVLGAGLQQQRDVLGHNIQLEQMGYGAGLQSQQNQQNSQLRQQEEEHGANLQAQLSQVQLNQSEEMRLRRLQQAASHTDEQVQAGFLTPEEAAQLKTQIMTGLNPLQNRHLQAQTLQSQIQSQAMYQHADQQAQLFNRQQAIRAMNPQQRMQEFTDANGNRAMFQLSADGDWTPLDFNASQRADQASNVNTARAASDINVQQEMLPANLRNINANIEHTRASAQTTNALRPGQVTHQDRVNASLQQTMDFAREMQPGNRQHQALVNDSIVQHLEQGADLHQDTLRMNSAQLADLRQRTEHAAASQPANLALLKANAQLAQQHARNEPDNQQARLDALRANTRHTIANAALTELQVNGGVPQTTAAHAYETIDRAISADLNDPSSRIGRAINAVPVGPDREQERTRLANEYRATQTTQRVQQFRSMFQQLTRPPDSPTARRNDMPGPGDVAGPHGAPGTTPIDRSETGAATNPPPPVVVPAANDPQHRVMLQALDALQTRADSIVSNHGPIDNLMLGLGARRMPVHDARDRETEQRRTQASADIREARRLITESAGRQMTPANAQRFHEIMTRLRALPGPRSQSGANPADNPGVPIGG